MPFIIQCTSVSVVDVVSMLTVASTFYIFRFFSFCLCKCFFARFFACLVVCFVPFAVSYFVFITHLRRLFHQLANKVTPFFLKGIPDQLYQMHKYGFKAELLNISKI